MTLQTTAKQIINSLIEKQSTTTQIPHFCILFLQFGGERHLFLIKLFNIKALHIT